MTAWLRRGSWAAAGVGGVAIGALAAVFAGLPRPTLPTRTDLGGPEATIAASQLPAPTQEADPAQVRRVQTALSSLEAACNIPYLERPPWRLVDPIHTITTFADRYPNARFRIHGTATSTLAILIVVRSEVLECDPRQTRLIDPYLPSAYRQ